MSAGQRLMLGFDGPELTPDFADLLHETGARSVILFARNIVSAAQCHDLIAEIRASVDWPLLFAVDQEGGPVVRITRGATVFPGNMALGAAGDPELARRQGRISGAELAAIGFDINLCPVVDLQTNPHNPGIGIRSFGAERAAAAALSRALIRGHAEAGVACCLKHFPGKGAAAVDAHIDLPVLDATLAEFREPHLEIFRELFDASDRLAVMTTHLLVRGLDPDRPATLSRRVTTDLLRDELGFDGLVMTDDLEMGAIVKHYGVAEACVEAAWAGHDVLPICHDPARQRAGARALDGALASGRLDAREHAASVARIEAFTRGREPRPRSFEAGDDVAREIAARAVHVFADPAGLLPVAPTAGVRVLAARPHAVVSVEDSVERDYAAVVDRCFAAAGLEGAEVVPFGPDLDSAAIDALLAAAAADDRVVLLSWNAHGNTGMRSLLDRACRTLASRLVVVHLRNPFDQAFVPAGVTALTGFGYRVAQLEALARVIAGREPARGHMPAPLQ